MGKEGGKGRERAKERGRNVVTLQVEPFGYFKRLTGT